MFSDNRNIFRKTDIIIIDEVSMLRADLFDYLNKLCKKLMENDLFLG
jgi:ATP-dependent exoDNAse (exonuclease V) alpha subunit